ncbi:La domain-containing protein [Cephalotus follicularis]|uniref:La domain-containing protein n=1 Tax=Cephalotus follicularis TaxID=3775 RepID=A0A1Q3D412_CEPFO|nr:La domain-containing protein [Cephalotus follicularis]
MATTADSSSNHHSPRGSGFPGDGVSSPQFRRKNLPSPWAQVVRGDSSESITAAHLSPSSSPPPPSSSSPMTCVPEQAPFTDCSPTKAAAPDNPLAAAAEPPDGNAAKPMKPAWKKPSNGVVETSPTVMGADSWPALSAASTKPSPKSSSSTSSADSASKTVADGSVPSSQVLEGPVISHAPQKQVTATNANSNSNHNHNHTHTRTARQRSVPDPSPREAPYRGNSRDTRPTGGFVSQSHVMNDHRHSTRRGNYGQRGDGPHHNNIGSRRDQDRGNYVNARDVHMTSHRGHPRGFVRPPPPNAGPFIHPQALRPYGNPIGYPELLYVPTMPMEPFRGMPIIPHSPPPGIILPVPEPPVPALLVHQIEYYFSDSNLVKDEYLKSNMDAQGWVPISLIASFPRVKNLTNNIQLILDSLRTSTVVEVQDDKVRRRNDWMKWIHNSGWQPTESGFITPGGLSYDKLTTSIQKMTMEEVAADQNSTTSKATPYSNDVPVRRSSELTNQSQLSSVEDAEGLSQADQSMSTHC